MLNRLSRRLMPFLILTLAFCEVECLRPKAMSAIPVQLAGDV